MQGPYISLCFPICFFFWVTFYKAGELPWCLRHARCCLATLCCMCVSQGEDRQMFAHREQPGRNWANLVLKLSFQGIYGKLNICTVKGCSLFAIVKSFSKWWEAEMPFLDIFQCLAHIICHCRLQEWNFVWFVFKLWVEDDGVFTLFYCNSNIFVLLRGLLFRDTNPDPS